MSERTPVSGREVVNVRDLLVTFGNVVALQDVSFKLHRGTVCALIGMNGSGKSTLFKSLMRICTPTAGKIELGTTSVGYLPQNEDVDWTFPLSVFDVVLMGRYGKLGLSRKARAVDLEKARAGLLRVGMQDYEDRQIGELSGGQRKRVFLARSLAQEADLLLLDEPFAGVDKTSEETIAQVLKNLAENGTTVLIATHDLTTLPQLATEAILLQNRIILHDQLQIVLKPENLAQAFGVKPA